MTGTPRDIDAYLAAVAARLQGSRRHRRQLLEEMRDGLESAAEHHQQAGLSRAAAERAAVAEWGEVDLIVRDLASATLHCEGTRLSSTVLAITPVLALVWVTFLLAGPKDPWPQGPPEVELGGRLLGTLASIAVAAALCGLLTLRGTGALTRPGRQRLGHQANLWAGTGLLLGLTVNFLLLLDRVLSGPDSVDWQWAVIPIGLSCYVTFSVHRTLNHLRAAGRLACTP
ncbi:permease prefix domain 1-containing protein [Actinomadura kijaniata]|uniref:permease prefix domain 1-containing protein n=1 Tax=Actinomadura kijaniata TaxID=46161 RepID=UPI003F1BB292